VIFSLDSSFFTQHFREAAEEQGETAKGASPMGMKPRWYRDGSVYSQTQRTVDRQFFFKPDPVVRNIIGACAARALKDHPVKIYWLEFNINHEQTGIAPRSDSAEDLTNIVNFKRTFHRLLAEDVNRYLRRKGAVFSTRSRDVECVDDPSLERQFFYAMTNPVKDGLVDRVAHWKGFSSYNALARGDEETFTYIDRTAWHRQGGERSGKPPEAFTRSIHLEYTPLPQWEALTPSKRQALIRRECRELEKRFREEREQEGRPVMSAARMARIDHRDRPTSEPERTPKPLCHASTPEAARRFEEEYRTFLDAYVVASAAYRQGDWNAAFPRGSLKPPLMTVQV
jgi:hypothetical protein